MAIQTRRRNPVERRNALTQKRETTLFSPEEEELRFDYNRIDEKYRGQVIEAARDIKPRLKRAANDIFAVGERLNQIKNLLSHGDWLDWLQQEFDLSERLARNFMAVDKRLGTKSAKFADLPPSSLYLLASPSTPTKALEAVELQIDEGDTPTYGEVKQVIEMSFADIDDLKSRVQIWLKQKYVDDLAKQIAILREIAIGEKAGKAALNELNQARDLMPDAWRRADLLQACQNLLAELDTERIEDTKLTSAAIRLYKKLDDARKVLEGQAENDCVAVFDDAEVSRIREQLTELMERLKNELLSSTS